MDPFQPLKEDDVARQQVNPGISKTAIQSFKLSSSSIGDPEQYAQPLY